MQGQSFIVMRGCLGWHVQVGPQVLGYGSQGTMVYEGCLHGRTVAVKRLLRHLYHLAKKEIDALILSDEVSNSHLPACISSAVRLLPRLVICFPPIHDEEEEEEEFYKLLPAKKEPGLSDDVSPPPSGCILCFSCSSSSLLVCNACVQAPASKLRCFFVGILFPAIVLARSSVF